MNFWPWPNLKFTLPTSQVAFQISWEYANTILTKIREISKLVCELRNEDKAFLDTTDKAFLDTLDADAQLIIKGKEEGELAR